MEGLTGNQQPVTLHTAGMWTGSLSQCADSDLVTFTTISPPLPKEQAEPPKHNQALRLHKDTSSKHSQFQT